MSVEWVDVQAVHVGAECRHPLTPDKYFIRVSPVSIKGFQHEITMFRKRKDSTLGHVSEPAGASCNNNNHFQTWKIQH